MDQINYIGENLWPGHLGQMAVILGFVASLFAVAAYSFSTNAKDEILAQSWKNWGRLGFSIHGLSVFAVIGILFNIMIEKRYEYQYAFEHVSEDLPFAYIFSAFWEGQEGSFLLWMFWHVVLGMILMLTSKRWESPVMATLASIQAFIGSMILGIYITETTKMGISPFLLVRDLTESANAPLFMQEDYVDKLKDFAEGLNPLLQNYWNTIHPPTLFLGFASTAVPFCFAIAGLWTGDHKGWLKPVLPWALFSGAILGTGILMGGAWAYEALSFGGYWAWDPVENMSLVPWLILIAGLHTNLIANATGHSIKSSYLYYMFTFVLIVYSTFLTRSGVLGDTSVHAFTDLGLEWHLVGFIAFFTILSLAAFFMRVKSIPSPKKEEPTSSREFWMFIGTLVLLFSGIIIATSTSLPVYNKIRTFFEPTFEGSVIVDPEEHYNKYHLYIAIFIAFLSSVSQFLRYREFNWKKHSRKVLTHVGLGLLLAGILTYFSSLWINITAWQYGLMLFAGLFAVVANIDYFFTMARGSWKQAGSALAHFGFGAMLVGILASGLNKEYVSNNPFVQRGIMEGATEEQLRKNVRLRRDKPLFMNGYEVTYLSDTIDLYTRTFQLRFKQIGDEGEIKDSFDVFPNILYNKDFTKIAASNPSTKRYATYDIFTHIAGLPAAETDVETAQAIEDSLNYQLYELGLEDTLFTTKHYAIFEDISFSPSHPDYKPKAGDLGMTISLRIHRLGEENTWTAKPALVLRDNLIFQYPVKIDDLSLKVKIPTDAFERFFVTEDELNYEEFSLQEGQSVAFEDRTVTFKGFDRNASHPAYTPEEGDLAVSAILEISDNGGNAPTTLKPLYLIRGNKPFNIKDVDQKEGLHARLASINPKSESITLNLAKQGQLNNQLLVEIAEDALPSDYIVLEAIKFPGINLFWLGSSFMMIGLFISLGVRSRNKNKHS